MAFFNESGAEVTVQGPQSNAVAGIPLTVGLTGGGYVVLWQNDDGVAPGDVVARIYNAAGTPQGAAFTVFDDYVNFAFPRNIDVIALPNGGFAIASQHVDQAGSSVLVPPVTSDIQLQYFSATGTATTAPIFVTPGGSQATASVSEPDLAIANGKLVVTWDGGSSINTAIYDLAGNVVTPTFAVDASSVDTRSPALTALANGNFMEVWRSASSDRGDIRAAIYSDSGAAIGTSFVVNTGTTGIQAIPHVATLANGNTIVTWADYSTATVTIHGQLVSSSGTLIGQEVVLADTTVSSTDQFGALTDTNLNDYGLTALTGGGFVIAFNNNKDAGFIFTREFNSQGAALGSATQISNEVGFFPHIDALAGGGYEVVWNGAAQVQTVFAQTVERSVFDPAGGVLVANFNVANGWTSQNLYPRHVADMNGDGNADIVGFGQQGVLVSYQSATGGSFGTTAVVLADFGQTKGWTSDNQYHRAVADLNGDGKADVIGFGIAGTLVSTAIGTGSFSAVKLGVADFGQTQGWASQDGFARLVGDVNGDGKADIVGFGYAGALVALGNGDGTFQAVKLGVANFGQNQGWTSDNTFHRELADVNGDGKLDVVGFGIAGTYVALSNGDGTFADAKLTFLDYGTNQGWSNNDGFSRIVADVNNDGKADIVGFTYNGALVSFGNGDGTFQPVRQDVSDFGRNQGWTSDNSLHRELADINHDGKLDVVGFGIAGVLAGTNHFDIII